MPIFDIIVVEPTLVALALLPPSSVFILAAINAAFIGLIFTFMPRTPDLIQVMQFDGHEVVTRPLYLLIFVVGVCYPVMRSVLCAIVMGDRAKKIAKVQHDQAEREARIAREKSVLDQDIAQMVEMLTQTINGNQQLRIPIPTSPSLGPIADSLNILLARIRRSIQSDYELQHTRQAAMLLLEALRASKHEQELLQLRYVGNPIIDAIAMELMADQKHASLKTSQKHGSSHLLQSRIERGEES
ncbi:hypothetical protein EPA93_45000 [Ktedonosporobacter rubrisoli]|uniref:HAMP domain-containing protein n=1 Tax=Ktedonosporobacter rubrisoli TaxID=2509675 RepID=A0A4P6K3C0_KTERU|nr:hypothetical protein [Ktedonosporobacter rubrisoli]QBD82747.1 hypothetical protein EPA93_45000 [Ktedonosporobacter rubrisoli]